MAARAAKGCTAAGSPPYRPRTPSRGCLWYLWPAPAAPTVTPRACCPRRLVIVAHNLWVDRSTGTGKRIHLSHRQTYTPQPEDQGLEEVPRQYARKPPSSPGAEQSSPSLRPPRSSSTPSPPAVASSRLHVFSRDRHRVAAATTPCRPLSWPLSVAGRLRPVLHRDPLLLRLWIPLPVPGHLLSAPHSLRD